MMSTRPAPHGMTGRHLLLVRAACSPLPMARQAWAEWRRQSIPEKVDPEEWPLLPWLSSRAGELNMCEADQNLLLSMKQYVWLQNQSHLNAAEELCTVLLEEGMRPLFVKGLPLLLTVYGEAGLCRLSDVDWQLPADQVEPAVRLLQSRGWRLEKKVRESGDPVLDPKEFEGIHAVHHALRRPGGGSSCELHWNLLRFPVAEVDEAPLFAAALAMPVRRAEGLRPCPADLLLQVMVRGYSWERSFHTLRWVVDSCLLVQRAGIDWERFEAEARRRGVSLLLADAGDFLNQIAPGSFDEVLLARLRKGAADDRTRGVHLHLSGDWRLAARRGYLASFVALRMEDWKRRMRARRLLGLTVNPLPILGAKARRGLSAWWSRRQTGHR